MIVRVFLKKGEEREILQGFPWVFDNEIGFVKYRKSDCDEWTQKTLDEAQIQDGVAVEVFSCAGGFLGTGIINRSSKITVRLISREHKDVVFSDIKSFWFKRVSDAVNVRRINYSERDSYRLIFAEADLIPGLIVERYCDVKNRVVLVVQFLSLSCEIFRKEILSALEKFCNPFAIYEKDDEAVREKENLPLKSSWIYKHCENEIIIEENGVKIAVDVQGGQKTGYFLDQKSNRETIKKYCHGKKVLDSFSHTGAFGLNAFLGGAKEVVCVDIAQEAVELIEKNIDLNGAKSVVKAVQADVFDVLKKYESDGEKFDVIILDPPAFTKSAKNIQKAYSGYKEINLRSMRLLNEGGILVSCSCSHFFDEATFYDMLMHAAKDSHRRVQVLEKRGAGSDHPVLLGYPKSQYLKCAICRVF